MIMNLIGTGARYGIIAASGIIAAQSMINVTNSVSNAFATGTGHIVNSIEAKAKHSKHSNKHTHNKRRNNKHSSKRSNTRHIDDSNIIITEDDIYRIINEKIDNATNQEVDLLDD